MWRVGDVIHGRYRVLAVHEDGGMGLVYRVRHLGWGTDLAAKTPRPELVGGQRERDLFVSEAQTWISLGLHPNVCGCYYVQVLDGIPRAFAEYVDGGSLRDWIDDRRLYAGAALERMLDVAIQFGWGLAYAHGRGLVHQDVKPGNVLLGAAGREAKVTDFGLARAGGERAVGWTTAYASPEQLERRELGPASDVYSFAVSVLEMFTGRVTWLAGPAAGEVLAGVVADGAGDGGLPGLPDDVAGLLAECLRRGPGRRPAMAEVAARLAGCYQEVTGRRYPRAEPEAVSPLADELSNRALSLLDLGQPAAAERAFEEALAADPRHLAAVWNAGLTRWRAGVVTDTELITSLEEVRGDARRTQLLLAHVHLERGDLAGARAALDAADPGEPEVAALRHALEAGQVTDAGRVEEHRVPWSEPWDLHPGQIVIADYGRTALTVDTARAGVVKVWNVLTGQCRHVFEGHRGEIGSAGISADGRFGVTSGRDGAVHVWDLDAGRRLHSYRVYADNGRDVGEVPVCAGAGLVLWLEDHIGLRVRDPLTGESVADLADPWILASSVAISADGRIALAADGLKAAVWDLRAGRRLSQLTGAAHMDVVCLSADGRLAATGNRMTGPAIEVWDTRTGRRTRALTGHDNRVEALSFSPDGRRLLSSDGPTVRLWDTSTGRCLRTYPGHGVGRCAVRLHASHGLSAGRDNTVRKWSLPGPDGTGHVSPLWLSRPRPAVDLGRRESEVRELVGSARQAMAAGRYQVALQQLLRARAVPGYATEPRVMAAWRELSRHCRRTGPRASWEGQPVAGRDRMLGFALAADGRSLVTRHSRGVLRLRAPDGADVRTLAADTSGKYPLGPIAISSAGGLIAVVTGDADREQSLTCQLWRANGERVGTLRIPAVTEIRFTADGRRMMSAGWDGVIRLWDLGDLRCLREIQADDDSIGSLWPAADGRHVLAAGRGSVVKLWDVDRGECVRELHGHTSGVLSACLSPDDRHALSCGVLSDRTTRLWDMATGECLRVFETPSRTCVVRFSPDGAFALTGCHDGAVRVWDPGNGRCLHTFTAHADSVYDLAMSPDGDFVLSYTVGEIRRWELDWELANGDGAAG